MGRHEPSLKYHDKSLEIKPDFDYALYAKRPRARLARPTRGRPRTHQSEPRTNPNYDHAWMAKAEALHHLGRLEEARDALNNTLILNGSFDEAWVFRGKILEEMGNALEANGVRRGARVLPGLLEIEPDNAELRVPSKRSSRRTWSGWTRRSTEYAAAASKAHGADSLHRLSALMLRVGRAADALVPAMTCARETRQTLAVWLAAGRALLALGRPTDAEVSFRRPWNSKPLRRNPNCPRPAGPRETRRRPRRPRRNRGTDQRGACPPSGPSRKPRPHRRRARGL